MSHLTSDFFRTHGVPVKGGFISGGTGKKILEVQILGPQNPPLYSNSFELLEKTNI